MTDKVFVVDMDELEQKNPEIDPVSTVRGMYNAKDFISVPFPAGYTHIQLVYKDKSLSAKITPIGDPELREKGGFYVVLSSSALKRIRIP